MAWRGRGGSRSMRELPAAYRHEAERIRTILLTERDYPPWKAVALAQALAAPRVHKREHHRRHA